MEPAVLYPAVVLGVVSAVEAATLAAVAVSRRRTGFALPQRTKDAAERIAVERGKSSARWLRKNTWYVWVDVIAGVALTAAAIAPSYTGGQATFVGALMVLLITVGMRTIDYLAKRRSTFFHTTALFMVNLGRLTIAAYLLVTLMWIASRT